MIRLTELPARMRELSEMKAMMKELTEMTRSVSIGWPFSPFYLNQFDTSFCDRNFHSVEYVILWYNFVFCDIIVSSVIELFIIWPNGFFGLTFCSTMIIEFMNFNGKLWFLEFSALWVATKHWIAKKNFNL